MLAGAWSTTAAALPAGWAPGELAVLVEVVPASPYGLPSAPAGWSPQASTPVSRVGLSWVWIRVSTRVLRAGDTAPGVDSSGWSGRVLVDESGSSGIRVSSGSALVSVRSGGTGVVVGLSASDSNPPGTGVTWLPGRAQAQMLIMFWPVPAWVAVGTCGAGTSGDSQTPGLGVEFLPPVGPRTPVLTSPGAGDEVNSASPSDWSWQYQPSKAGGSQGGWEFRISSTSGWLYWSQALGALTSTETQNPGSAQGVTLPAGVLDNLGVARTWTVNTQEALDGLWSGWAPERTVTPVTPPTVAVSVASAPGDLSPTVTGTPTITRPASVVVASQWRVRDALSQIVWDSGVRGGNTVTATVPASTPWVNGATYKASGRIQQTGGAWSAWAESAPFTMSWDAPAEPVVVVTDDPVGGVLVDVSSLTVGADVVVSSSVDGGVTWDLVDAFPADFTGVRVTDPLVAHRQPMLWSAVQFTVVDGIQLPSSRGVSAVHVPTSDQAIVTSAYAPASRWVLASVVTMDDTTWPRATGVHQPLGPDPYAVVLRGPERARQGGFTLAADTEEQRAQLHALCQCGDPLILMANPEGSRFSDLVSPGERVTIQVTTPHKESRFVQRPYQRRDIPVQWVECPTPAIGEAPPSAAVTHPIIPIP